MKADGAEARLPVHVTMLAGTIGERHVPRPRSLAAAADFIAEDWRAHGHTLDPTSLLVDGHSDTNLIATCAGRTLANEILLIAVHYDTVSGSPGADDNASGVAGLLELSGAFGELEPEPTVRFVAVTNEEPRFCFTQHMGSAVNAAAARARGDRIALMVSREMLGYDDYRAGSQHYPPLFRWF